MFTKKRVVVSALGAAFALILACSAWGHAAIVWAYVEGEKVYVEAFYASGKKLQNAKVVVVDSSGKSLLEGTTDNEGKFSYRPVSKVTQTVVVSAGESHVGDFELTADDLAEIKPE
nr:carboxypeptidase regulatory-like domain-containing protein [Desulfobulbaceae bacterium]